MSITFCLDQPVTHLHLAFPELFTAIRKAFQELDFGFSSLQSRGNSLSKNRVPLSAKTRTRFSEEPHTGHLSWHKQTVCPHLAHTILSMRSPPPPPVTHQASLSAFSKRRRL